MDRSRTSRSWTAHTLVPALVGLLFVAASYSSPEKTTTAEPTSTDGQIVFLRSDRGDTQTIYVAEADGSDERQLTGPGEYCCLLRLSPDHERLLVMPGGAPPLPTQGGVLSVDGSEFHLLETSDPTLNLVPHAWSPDGERIAFQRGSVAIVTVATGAVTYLNVVGLAAHPSWSPDGRHIAFTRLDPGPNGAEWQLYTVRADGTGMRLRTTNPLWGGGVSPTWIAR